MERFRNIVVYPSGLHPQEVSVAAAAELARKTGASLTIVSIVAPRRSAERERAFLLRRKQRRRGAALHNLAARLGREGVTARPVLLTGTSGAALILAEVRRARADLLIKTARPDDESRSGVFGTVAARLLRESPCPVWIARPRTEVPRPIVLAAISPQHAQASMEAIDAEVLDVASQLAQLRDAELHVVSVWRADAARALRGRVPGEDLRAYLRECEAKARRDLRVFLSRSGCLVPALRLHVIRGNAAEIISRTAEDVEAELVVVGSAGRRGLTRLLLRNTAEDVLAQTKRPVLGVRAIGAGARSA